MHAVCHLRDVDEFKAEVNKMNKDTLKFKNTSWFLWLKNVSLCLIRIIHSTHPQLIRCSEVFESVANYYDTSH